MVDKKVTGLNEETSVLYTDISYLVDDPGGTPASKKATAQNLVKGGASQGAVSAIIDANLTASKNLVSDVSGKIVTTTTEYVDKSGDTMTGNFTVETNNATFNIKATIATNNVAQQFYLGGVAEGRILIHGALDYFEFRNLISNQAFTLSHSGGAAITAPLNVSGAVTVSGTAATISSGTGSPESVLAAPIGSLYTRTDGGAGTTLYVKESGAGNTGWIAK